MLYIYNSSAGSGKTFTLVKEYLKIIFSADEINHYKHILAITFTNKAANEMKERIIHSLSALSSDRQDTMLLQIHDETQIPVPILQEKAAKIKHHLLHHYSDFSVMTIDAFTNKIVKAFAFELQIPSNYDIELDTNMVAHEAIYRLLKDVSGTNDNLLTKILVEWLKSFIEEDKGNSITYGLHETAKLALSETLYTLFDRADPTDVAKTFDDLEKLKAIKLNFENTVSAQAKSIADSIFSDGLTPNDYHYAGKGIAAYIARLAAGDFSKLEKNSFICDSIANKKYAAQKAGQNIKAKIETLIPQIHPRITALSDYIDEQSIVYYSAIVLIKEFYPFVLVSTINHYLQQYKKENNTLLISDFHRLIFQTISTQSIPVIYERIGEKYTSVLIDEFQDTSSLQWQNLLPLVANAQENNGTSLIVGDPKQAIYRFKGGNVEQFVALPDIPNTEADPILNERQNVLKNYGYQLKNLATNYRSTSTVVDFNNHFFEYIKAALPTSVTPVYKDIVQQTNKTKLGYVEIALLPKEEYKDSVFAKIRATIETALHHQYSYRDIAILTRSNKIAVEIANELITGNIPVISEESLLIGNSPVVQKIVTVLHYLSDTHNSIRKGEMITQFHLLDINEEINTFIQTIQLPYYEFEKFVSEKINQPFSAKELRKKSLPEKVYAVLELFSLYDKQNPFLQFFLDEVNNFSVTQSVLLHDFLYWWEENKSKCSITYPDTLNAVKIMTIHKAKGLQFPVVIVPFFATVSKSTGYIIADAGELDIAQKKWAVKPTKMLSQTIFEAEYKEEVTQKLLDEVNIGYVACTRAESALYIICEEKSEGESKNTAFTDFVSEFAMHSMQHRKQIYYWQNDQLTVADEKKHEENPVFTLSDFAAKRNTALQIKPSPTLKDSNAQYTKEQFGLLLHDILQQIVYLEDYETVQQQIAAMDIQPDDKTKMLHSIQNILADARLATYFDRNNIEKVYNERSILDATGNVKRPDRIIVLKNGETVLMDYKTGNKSPNYHRQLTDYADTLSQIGYTITKCIIVYIEKEHYSTEIIPYK